MLSTTESSLVYSSIRCSDLSPDHILQILNIWNVPEWKDMNDGLFYATFARSVFHLLSDERGIIHCASRINFNFHIRIAGELHPFPELVGLASLVAHQGYGTLLLSHLRSDLQEQGVEAIGFCAPAIRPFYKKCNVGIMPAQARHLREEKNNQWVVSSDDDIMDLTLSRERRALLESLSDRNPGYLVF